MRSTEQKIRIVNATTVMEGMPLTDEDKRRLQSMFDGQTSVDKTVQDLIAEHSQVAKKNYSKYDYEYEWDNKYCYPGSFIEMRTKTDRCKKGNYCSNKRR